jgi:hypothetical protein
MLNPYFHFAPLASMVATGLVALAIDKEMLQNP